MAVVSRDNTTDYVHPQETNLLNTHKAMAYDSFGQPYLRTSSVSAGSQYKNATETTAFGEPLAIPITPVLQADAIYGLLTKEFDTFSFGDGAVSSSGTVFQTDSGTQVGSYGVIRTKDLLRYRPGQGAMTRFTAAFSDPKPGTTQRAGLFAQEQALNIGYDGTQFGILRQNGGKAAIYELQVTAAAGGTETATVTLDGQTYTVALTSGTIAQTAAQLGNATYAGWSTEHYQDRVLFLKNLVGPVSGAFTYTSTGSSAGTMTQLQAGVNHTLDWIYQSEWNIDPLDGTGPSGITLDHSKLNVFQISFRWLGAGEIRFAMENPENGDLMFFHHIHYSNRNTDVHLDNPSFKIGYIAANLTLGTVENVRVIGASILGAIEGVTPILGLTNAITSDRKTTLGSNTLHHILSVKNRLTFVNKINLRSMNLNEVGIAFQGNDPLEFFVFFNQATSVPLQWISADGGESSALYSTTTATILSSTAPAVAYVLPAGGSANFDISNFNIRIPPNNYVSIGVRSAQSISSILGSAIWSET